jgi:prophage regulatory protein
MNDQHPSCSTCSDAERVQFLRLRAVSRMTGLARSTILRMIAKNDFPPPVRLTTRVIAWRRSDLERWSEQRPTVTH